MVSRISPLGTVRGVTGGNQAFIKVYGVPEAIAKLKLVGSVAGREVGLIVRNSAIGVVDKARANVHSSSNVYNSDYAYTDSLYNGIQVTAEGGRAGGLGSYTQAVSASSRAGGADREYAQFEEEGTSDTPAHPYLRPALSQQVPETAALLKVMAATLERL